MDCPKCGYAMTDFDVECPRCARAQAQPTRSAPAAAPTPLTPTTQPSPVALPGVSRPRNLVISHGMAWAAACCPIMAIGIDLALRSAGVSSGWVILAIAIGVNGVILEADRKYLASLGLDTSSLHVWLIPSYLFARPSVAGGSNAYGVLWCVLFCLSVLVPAMPGTSLVADGEHIDAAAHFESVEQQGYTWAGTIVVDDGPLRGTKLAGGGTATVRFSPGVHCRVSGTVRLQGNQILINPMQVTPVYGQ